MAVMKMCFPKIPVEEEEIKIYVDLLTEIEGEDIQDGLQLPKTIPNFIKLIHESKWDEEYESKIPQEALAGVKTSLTTLKNITEALSYYGRFELPEETIEHPEGIFDMNIEEMSRKLGALEKKDCYPDLSEEDLESIIKLFIDDFDGSGQVCMTVLGMLFSEEEDQKKFLSRYVYPRLVSKIYDECEGEKPKYITNYAHQELIEKMLEDKDGIANVVRLIGHSYQGFGGGSPTLLSDTQITALREMCKAATEEKKVVIKLGAGEGKTFLSKLAAKIFPDVFNQPIIHIAPFNQHEPGIGGEGLADAAFEQVSKYIVGIEPTEREEFKQAIIDAMKDLSLIHI